MLSYLYREFMEATEDIEFQEPESPEDPSKFTFYLRDNLQIPIIKDKLKEKRIQQSIIEFVGKFIDENSSIPIYIYSSDGKYFGHENDRFKNMFYIEEEKRGLCSEENHAIAGSYEIEIKPNENK